MLRKRFPYLVLAAALLVTLVQVVLYWSQLPPDIASHFDAKGVANGWMPKTGFFALMLCTQFGTAGMLIGASWLLGKMPTSMINIPNREYWLEGPHREATLADNRNVLVWITALTAIFLVFVFQLTINTNLQQAGGIDSLMFWVGLAVYMLIIMTLVLRLNARYKNVPEEPNGIPA